jgi:hypothetical protein
MDFSHEVKKRSFGFADREITTTSKQQLTVDDLVYFYARSYAEKKRDAAAHILELPRTLEPQITRVPR